MQIRLPSRLILLLVLLILPAGYVLLGIKTESLLVLAYHRISERPTGPVPSVTPAEFARQMDYLARAGYRSISPDALAVYLHGGRLPCRRAVLITFDDGWADNYTLARPILNAHGFTATVFMISGRVGGHGCLTASQLRALVRAGWTIGAHTVTHPHLPALGPAQAEAEISAPLKILSGFSGRPVTAFAYPYGDQDDLVRSLVRAADYATAFSTQLGLPHPGQDLLAVKRLIIPRRGGSILLRLAVNPWLNPLRRVLDACAGLPPVLMVEEAYSRRLGRHHPRRTPLSPLLPPSRGR